MRQQGNILDAASVEAYSKQPQGSILDAVSVKHTLMASVKHHFCISVKHTRRGITRKSTRRGINYAYPEVILDAINKQSYTNSPQVLLHAMYAA